MPIVYKPVSRKVLIEQAKENDKAVQKEIEKEASKQAEKIEHENAVREEALSSVKKFTSRRDQAVAFKESVRVKLVEYALFNIFNKVMYKVSKESVISKPTDARMQAMINEFVNDIGGPSEVLSKMTNYGHTTYFLSETAKIINKHFKRIIEGVEENNPDTMEIDQDKMDDFKQDIDQHVDDVKIEDPIEDKVIQSVSDFVTQNAETREKIAQALEVTKEKIESIAGEDDIPEEDQEDIVAEYARLGKRLVNDIRDQSRSMFSEMVHAMGENVIANPKLYKDYLNENSRVDMKKVIDGIATMYAFMETTVYLRLVKPTPEYIKETIDSIRNYK